jgi:hypothetical protein
MKCRLCYKDCEVMESHIVPKFIYNWIKNSGTGRLRQLRKFNTPMQDGIKAHLLCKECEAKFSKGEKWFSEYIFTPYINGSNAISYNNNLHYFIISLLWRVLVYFKDDGNKYINKELLDEVEILWRNYLLNGDDSQVTSNCYMQMIPDNIKNTHKIKNYFNYLFRAVDIDIVENEVKCFVYAKIPRFIIIANIFGLNEANFEGLKINTSNGTITNNFCITDPDIQKFIYSRMLEIKNYNDLTENQKILVNSRTKKNIDKYIKSDYWKILKKG